MLLERLLLVLPCLADAEPAIPPPPSFEGAFGRMIVTLIGLILLIFATVWILRRLSRGGSLRMGSGTGKLIHIVERRPLSPKSMLYIIEVNGKRLLISESQFEVRSHPTHSVHKEE